MDDGWKLKNTRSVWIKINLTNEPITTTTTNYTLVDIF